MNITKNIEKIKKIIETEEEVFILKLNRHEALTLTMLCGAIFAADNWKYGDVTSKIYNELDNLGLSYDITNNPFKDGEGIHIKRGG